jgi:MFS family permease
MIFFRSLYNPSGSARSAASVRTLGLLGLTLYPAGALLRQFGPDSAPIQVGGLLLILAALGCAALIAGTRLSRITAEEKDHLDEYEERLRAFTMERSYAFLVALLLIAVIYMALASDFGWWVPSGYDQWNGVFWGAFLFATLVPPTVLAFRLVREEQEEEQ